MSVDELYDFDRDNYKKNLIWQKLRPILEKKYPKQTEEQPMDYNNRLVIEFNKEVEDLLSKKN